MNRIDEAFVICQAKKYANKVKNPVNRKEILFMGDSITANPNGYVSHVTSILGVTTTNLAVSGATWCDRVDSTNTISNQLKSVIENMQDYIPDAIVISAGANDSISTTYTNDTLYTAMEAYYTSSGSVLDVDTVDRKNIFGATRYVVETLKKLYPNADIFLLSPIQSALSIKDYKVAYATGFILQEVAKRLSVNFINCVECGINSLNANETLSDGLHPNELGAKLQGQYVANKIIGFYASDRMEVFSDDVKGLITMDSSSISTTVGDDTQIKLRVYPYTTSNKDIIWSSSNESIAAVTNGFVTGVGIGTCTITAKASANQSILKTFNITVSAATSNGLIFKANELGVSNGVWTDSVSGIQSHSINPITTDNAVVIDGKFHFDISTLALESKTAFSVVIDAYLDDAMVADSTFIAIGASTISSTDESSMIFAVANAWDYDMMYGRVVNNWTYSDQKTLTYTKNANNKIIFNVDITNSTVTMYANSTAVTNSISKVVNTAKLMTISNITGGTPLSGKYNSIRIYDHLLTSDEIANV